MSPTRILIALIGTAESIDDVLCFSEVVETLEEADSIFHLKGLSPEFLGFLPKVKTVAGDIPNSKLFVQEVDKVAYQMNQMYDAKMKEVVAKVDVSKSSQPAKSHASVVTVSLALYACVLSMMLL